MNTCLTSQMHLIGSVSTRCSSSSSPVSSHALHSDRYYVCYNIHTISQLCIDTDTEGWMGVKEALIATSITGMIFSLIAAQPLLLLGITGPMMIFEECLHDVCLDLVIGCFIE